MVITVSDGLGRTSTRISARPDRSQHRCFRQRWLEKFRDNWGPFPKIAPQLPLYCIVFSDFNLKTSIYREGVPVPSLITVNPDRSYNLQMNHPPFPWLIKQAAGIQRGAMKAWEGEVAGKITR